MKFDVSMSPWFHLTERDVAFAKTHEIRLFGVGIIRKSMYVYTWGAKNRLNRQFCVMLTPNTTSRRDVSVIYEIS